jgi:hypothetical protein
MVRRRLVVVPVTSTLNRVMIVERLSALAVP